MNEVFKGTVDILITEDKKLHEKAKLLGIEDRVYSIEEYLEKVIAENPDLTDYKVLSVHKSYFGKVDLMMLFLIHSEKITQTLTVGSRENQMNLFMYHIPGRG